MPTDAHTSAARSGAPAADDTAAQSGPRFRAEARQGILDAARLVFQEDGHDARLEVIARRAGVGIATLYRRFPTREDLLREVCLDVMRDVTEEAALAGREEADAWSALVRVLHYCVSTHAAGMLPVAAGRFLKTEEVLRARTEYVDALSGLLDGARAEGALRAQVNHVDILLMLALISRPLPGADTDLAQRLAHRYLDLLVPALGAEAAAELAEPRLDQDALDALWNGGDVTAAAGGAQPPRGARSKAAPKKTAAGKAAPRKTAARGGSTGKDAARRSARAAPKE
ncbi:MULTISPECIES: TetR/AcrR family transcriptional regulator [unclassified Streptomyces]|uniref:TetR/AcrR family transcriptional regulator n=1 Tax=unclassified Streptomyces TaxID=2593676 RepID=UPI00278C8EA8|nr:MULTISPECIES: TetR/AcrR family transcriptional regulator [unclassified Streptomyces]